jgi:surface polysaccharide O-acyltransferase-like enzyme
MTASPQVAKPRDIRFDLLRAIAILGVVFIHAGALFQPGTGDPLAGFVGEYFRWAVPLFLMLSAFMSARSLASRSESYGEFLKRRWPPLLLSFVLFSVLYLAIFGDLSHLTLSTLVTKHFMGRGWSGQYFFLVLLQLLFFYPLLSRWKISHAAMGVALILTILGYFTLGSLASKHAALAKIGDIPFFYWLVYPIFGFYLYQQSTLYQKVSALPPLTSRLLWLALPLLIPIWGLLFPNQPMVSAYINPVIPVVSILMMCLTPAAFSGLSSPFWQMVSMAGVYSLGVFCLNPLLIFVLPKLVASKGLPHEGPAIDLVVHFIMAVVVVALAFGLSRAIELAGARKLVK